MPAKSPSRIFLARARPVRDRLIDAPTAEPDSLRSPGRNGSHGNHLDDVVIDLTGRTPITRRTPAPSQRARRWRWLPLATLVVLAVGAAALVAVNYSAALQWRERAGAAEQRAVQAERQAAASGREASEARRAQRVARQRRRALADQLAVSEADVAALEARVVALASERARVQDLGVTIGGAGAEARLRALEAQVDSCVAQVEAVRSGLISTTDVDGWRRALTAAEASCAQVASDIDALADGGA